MVNSTTIKITTLLMFTLLIVGFTANQARADVRINIGLGYPMGYVDHRHHGYIVHHHAPHYSYSHHYHPPKKYYSKHRHQHHNKSYRGYGNHKNYYRHAPHNYHGYYR